MVYTILKWFIIIITCLVLQTSFLPSIAVFGIQPDLLLLVLFFLSVKQGVLCGIFVGFFLGLGMDLYTPAILGQNALAKAIIGSFFGLFNERLMRIDPLMKIVILFLGFIIHDMIFSGAGLLKNGNTLFTLIPELFTSTLPRAFYTAIFAVVVYAWNTTIKQNLKQ